MRFDMSLSAFRASLLAALGLHLAGCGGKVVVDPAGGAGASGQGSSGQSSAGSGQPLCEGAAPILGTNGMDTGFVRCADGTIQRVAALSCDTKIDAPACAGNELSLFCVSDADCTTFPHGKCVHFEANFKMPGPYCDCVYSC